MWQTLATDDAIRAVILKGGAALGKSSSMPASADLANEPAVVAGLVAVIRRFRADGGAP